MNTATFSAPPLEPEALVRILRESPLLVGVHSALVAVSGGPDSVALLVAMQEAGYQVVAAHFDHALRPGSEVDAAFVASLSARLGVRVVVERRSQPMPHGSRQAGARRLRYEFLERTRNATGSDVVVVAHTADDVAEGVLLHLLRGTGLAGLRGMPAQNGAIVRPLLVASRRDVDEFLRARSLPSVDDPSNRDERYARVRVRETLLPALEKFDPSMRTRLARIATRAAGWQSRLERDSQALVTEPARSVFAGASRPVAAEALRQLYANAGGVLPALSRRQLTSMLDLIQRDHPGEVHLPGGRVFRAAYGCVAISGPSDERRHAKYRIAISECSDPAAHEVSDAAPTRTVHLRAGGRIHSAHRRPGMRMKPLPRGRTRRVQDILVDAKVPRHERDSLPFVFVEDRLAWIPGVALDGDLAARPGEACVEVGLEVDLSSQEGR